MQTQANFTSATAANGDANPAWDFTGSWMMYDGHTAPLLRSFMTPLTVTANNAIKTYDGLAYSGGGGVSYSTTPNGNLLGTPVYGGTSQSARNADSYTITPSGLYSNQQGYILSYASGTLTVNRAPLTATVAEPGKVYDGNTAAAPTLTITAGLVGSETVTAAGTGTFNSKDVASASLLTINSTTLANGSNGGLASNYSLASGQTVAANIAPKALSVGGITAGSRIYDGGIAATVDTSAASFAGLVAGDAVSVSATGAFADKNVGAGKSVTLVSGYSGTDLGNYTVTGQTGTTADITPRALTISGTTASNKVYDGDTSAAVNTAAATFNGLIAGDVVNLSATGAFVDANVGVGKTVLLTNSYSGPDIGNYRITQQPRATADITPAAQTLNPAPPEPVLNAATQTPSPSTPEPILNAMTQIQSSVLQFPSIAQPVGLSLSPALPPASSSSSASAGKGATSSLPRSGNAAAVSTTMRIGATGPELQIMNGGMRLPDNMVTAQQ
jgi:hypothetical protein